MMMYRRDHHQVAARCYSVEDGASYSGTRRRRIALETVILVGGSGSGRSAKRCAISSLLSVLHSIDSRNASFVLWAGNGARRVALLGHNGPLHLKKVLFPYGSFPGSQVPSPSQVARTPYCGAFIAAN